MVRALIILLSAVLLSSCGGRQTASIDGGDTVRFRYAKLLQLVRHEGYTVATLKHPWRQDAVLHRYVLVPADGAVPEGSPEGTVIRTPLRRSVVFTTVHCSLLSMLHREGSVAGVADLKYIKAPYVQAGVSAGRIADCGDGMSPVIEKIIDDYPDALFLSPFENSGGYGKIEELDIPIVECADYMESSPLARAEWLRFYGMLFGCEQRADSLFQTVDKNYHRLKALAATAKTSPTVLMDKVTGSVWYVPGGRSTIGQMVQDANARYPWAADEHSGSVSLPFEAVIEKAGDADIWLFRYSGQHDITADELLGEHHGYDHFRAFKNHNAFGCDVERSQFYEESPFHPDWLLNDLITILHPDLTGLEPLRYYRRIIFP